MPPGWGRAILPRIDDRDVTASERPSARLFLIAGPGTPPADLAAAIGGGAAACVLLRTAGLDETALRAAIAALRPVAHERDAAFLLEGWPELAAETGCDGVHLCGGETSVEAARRAVGNDAVVGVSCGASRDAGIQAGEAGADYVAFGGGPAAEAPEEAAEPDLLDWWQAVMTPPSVAMGGAGPHNAEALARAGADFVAVGEAIWAHPDGPEAAARAAAAALARAGAKTTP